MAQSAGSGSTEPHRKKSVLQSEVAVNVRNADPKVFAPRNLARAQVEPVVDDGQHCPLDFLLQVPDYCLGKME